jgi:hypothetical protein
VAELSAAAYARIQALCKKGDALVENDDVAAALVQYWAAWHLLPEPKTQWEAATWILTAIGDANFLDEDSLLGARVCPWRCIAQTPLATLSCTFAWASASTNWATWTKLPTSWRARTWVAGKRFLRRMSGSISPSSRPGSSRRRAGDEAARTPKGPLRDCLMWCKPVNLRWRPGFGVPRARNNPLRSQPGQFSLALVSTPPWPPLGPAHSDTRLGHLPQQHPEPSFDKRGATPRTAGSFCS